MDDIDTINAFAIHEGWALFNNSDHGIRIERDDEAAKFDSDEDAIQHVTNLANSGSVMHIAALRIHNEQRGALKHTSGPWYWHYCTTVDEQCTGEQSDAYAITNVSEAEYERTGRRGDCVALIPHDTNHDANARLIAAAPDLLAALRETMLALNASPRFKVLASEYRDSYAIAALCDRAIAKAEGK